MSASVAMEHMIPDLLISEKVNKYVNIIYKCVHFFSIMS